MNKNQDNFKLVIGALFIGALILFIGNSGSFNEAALLSASETDSESEADFEVEAESAGEGGTEEAGGGMGDGMEEDDSVDDCFESECVCSDLLSEFSSFAEEPFMGFPGEDSLLGCLSNTDENSCGSGCEWVGDSKGGACVEKATIGVCMPGEDDGEAIIIDTEPADSADSFFDLFDSNSEDYSDYDY